MKFLHTHSYERAALIIARVLLAIQFTVAAWFKIVGFSAEAAMTAAVGVPFATAAVALALVLEVVGVLALLTGIKLRPVAFLMALYVALLAVLFYHDWSNQMNFGFFMSHLGLVAALLYVSVFGAKK
jgi:putative oxidoreductase